PALSGGTFGRHRAACRRHREAGRRALQRLWSGRHREGHRELRSSCQRRLCRARFRLDCPICVTSFCTSTTCSKVSRLLLPPFPGGFLDIEIRFVPRGLHHIVTLESLPYIPAAFPLETTRGDRPFTLFVDLDDALFLFHEIPPQRAA